MSFSKLWEDSRTPWWKNLGETRKVTTMSYIILVMYLSLRNLCCSRLLYRQKNCEPFFLLALSHKKKMSIYRLWGWHHDIMVQCWRVSAQGRLNWLVFWRVYSITTLFSICQSWRTPLASILLAADARFSGSQSDVGTHGERFLHSQKDWSVLSSEEYISVLTNPKL